MSISFHKYVEEDFYKFGEETLIPSDEFISGGKKLSQQVFRKLEEEGKATGKFSVIKKFIAGSVGKDTGILKPDFDLVVIVAEARPPFENILMEFEQTLRKHDGDLQINIGSIQRTRIAIKFTFCNGIEVDLLPGCDLCPEDVISIIKKGPKRLTPLYSSSLVEKQLDFLRDNDSTFLRIVIRLAKYWFQSLNFSGSGIIHGSSTIMELIAVAAAEEEEKRYPGYDAVTENFSLPMCILDECDVEPKCLRAFHRFIDMIADDIRSLKLCFIEHEYMGWKTVKVTEDRTKWRTIIPNVVGSENILERKRFIIEPANPYNDLLADKDDELLEELVAFAKETQARLLKLSKGKYVSLKEGEYVNFKKFFKAQTSKSESDEEEEDENYDEEDEEDDDFYEDDWHDNYEQDGVLDRFKYKR